MVCAGLANATAGDFAAASVNCARRSISPAAPGPDLEFEARMLADLADMLYRAGDLDVALEASSEAIAVSRRRTDRLAEVQATVVRGLTLAAADVSRTPRRANSSFSVPMSC